MMLAVFNCFSIPLNVAFAPAFLTNSFFNVVNIIIDFTFFLDILISFRTAIIDDLGNEIDTPCEIARHYLTTTFIIDMLATVPIDVIIESIIKK